MTSIDWKHLFNNLIPYGVRKLVAAKLRKSEGEVSHRFNPYHERKLATAEAMLEQEAIFAACPDAFRAIRVQIEVVWDSWEARRPRVVPSAAEVAKEHHDYVRAELEGATPDRKRSELAQSIAKGKCRLAHFDSVPVGIRKVG